ncbi:hypothetical protein ACOMHN_035025 [Nucella lapillus]
MKVVAVLLLATLVVVTTYANPEKRFFLKEVENVLNNLTHQLNAIINNAKKEFDHVAGGTGLKFDEVVALLENLITADETQQACVNVCHNGAESILGSLAPMAGHLCPIACKAALAKLQEAAG